MARMPRLPKLRKGTSRTKTQTKARTNGSQKSALDREEVAQVAYRLWEQRDRAHGSHEQDWQEAERIVRAGQERADSSLN
jgi:hypothetical protein